LEYLIRAQNVSNLYVVILKEPDEIWACKFEALDFVSPLDFPEVEVVYSREVAVEAGIVFGHDECSQKTVEDWADEALVGAIFSFESVHEQLLALIDKDSLAHFGDGASFFELLELLFIY